MEKSRPVALNFQELKEKANLISRSEFRSIRHGVGMVISFARMQSTLFRVGQPYRTNESRIVRVISGKGHISINLMEYDIEERMIIVTPPNSLIEIREITPDYDFQVIVPENDFLPVVSGNNLADLYEQNGTVLLMNEEEWRRTGKFYSLLWESMHYTPFRPDVTRHLIIALLNDIKHMDDQKQANASLHLSRQRQILHDFIALVNKYGKHERNISFYADKLCLTPHYLSTVIRETGGQTVMQWINQAVILEAKVLLKHSDMPVFRIADELNFPNPSFFSKFFKRMTGMTPMEYQKKG
ncbi:MAG: helix-turn-helix domain-containing protein [Bacteroides sp.]|nr:helix-turn-helix domain-containing protein [Bacteroides sp.]